MREIRMERVVLMGSVTYQAGEPWVVLKGWVGQDYSRHSSNWMKPRGIESPKMNWLQVQPDPEFKRCHQDLVLSLSLGSAGCDVVFILWILTVIRSRWPPGGPMMVTLYDAVISEASPLLLDSQTLGYTSFLEVLNQKLNLLYDWCSLGYLIIPEPVAVPKGMWCVEWLRSGNVLPTGAMDGALCRWWASEGWAGPGRKFRVFTLQRQLVNPPYRGGEHSQE